MKYKILTLAMCLLASPSYAQPTDGEIYAYRVMYEMMQNTFLSDELKHYSAGIKQGLEDALAGQPSRYSDEQFLKAMATIEQQKHRELLERIEENKRKGTQFLAENAKKAGVITTKSGLQYKIIKQGTGKKPKLNSEVRFHYESYSIDGTMTNSSYEYNAPFKGRLNEDVLEGIAEGVQYVQEGGEIELYIPPHLAYGDKDTPFVGKNSTIIIKIKLLKVK